MLSTIKHSYAADILRQKGIKFYSNGQRILDQLYHRKYPPLTTSIEIGKNYTLDTGDEQIEKIDSDYAYLISLGWKISYGAATGEFFDYQKTKYFLSPLNSNEPDYCRIPDKHHVLVDLNNQLIKFKGKNVSITGDSGWMPLNPYKRQEKKEIKHNPFQLDVIQCKASVSMEDNLPDWAKQKKVNTFPVEGILMGVTKNCELCCLEKGNQTPRIAITGKSGTGKSQTENNLEGGFKHKFDFNVFNINDVKYDTQSRCLPWDTSHTYYKELARFNEPTIPLPYVYLHPTVKGLPPEKIIYKDEVGFEISFPYREFLLDSTLMNYNKRWKTSDASVKHIRNLIEDNQGNTRVDGLIYAKNLEEIWALIQREIPSEQKSMRVSIFNLIKDVYSRRIVDKNTGVASKWVMRQGDQQYAGYPWDMCLLAGITPCLITAYARTEDWFGMWLKFILEDVFKFVKSKEYRKLQGKELMLCGDELTGILRNKSTKDIIDKVIREGRSDYIGFLQVVHHYKDIPDSIVSNLTHHFVFNTSADSDVKYLKNEFNLNKTQVSRLSKLKNFQCMAFGDFTLYDSNGNSYSNDGEPVEIIRIKKPNAQHWGGYKRAEA